MNCRLRRAALFGLLGICLAGFASPPRALAQEREKNAKEESHEQRELIFKAINFLILVGGLAYVLRKPMAEFFSSRSASIRKGLDEGRKALEASQAQLRAVEEKLRGLEKEIAGFKAAATSEMEAEAERLKRGSAEEAGRILESARAQTDTAVRAAKSELKKYAAIKAVTMAEEIVRARLDDPAHQRLVAEFAASLEAKERKK